MKKPKAKSSRLHGSREGRKIPTYVEYKRQFRRTMQACSFSINDLENMRLDAVYIASMDLEKASLQQIRALVRNPTRDIVRVSGVLMNGGFTAMHIKEIYDRLYSHGIYPDYGPGDFNWRINSHEYPIHVFVEILATSLLDPDLDNPAWGFVLALTDRIAFQQIMDKAYGFGLDFNAVRSMTRDTEHLFEEWKKDIFFDLSDLQDSQDDAEVPDLQGNVRVAGPWVPVPVVLFAGIFAGASPPPEGDNDVCDTWPIDDTPT